MNKETWAGMKAGAITGLLFMPIILLFLIVTSGNSMWDVARKFSQMSVGTGLKLSVETILLMMSIGFVLLDLVSGVLGLSLGIVFAKSERRLPTKSVYVKALIFGCILLAVVFLVERAFDYRTILTILAESSIFAALFNRWNKTPHLNEISSKSQSAPVLITQYCSQCGAKISNTNNKICSECGKPL